MTVALSISALVVSRMRLTEIEPAKSLPLAVVSAAMAADAVPSVPSRSAVMLSVGVDCAAPVMASVPPWTNDFGSLRKLVERERAGDLGRAGATGAGAFHGDRHTAADHHLDLVGLSASRLAEPTDTVPAVLT